MKNVRLKQIEERNEGHPPYAVPQTSACSKNISIHFARRTDVMPAAPQETKYHPSAVDLLLIKRLIAETSKQTLGQFLVAEFDTVKKPLAERLIGE